MQAWFDAAGKWYMTEEDISYAELPRAVRTAYEAGDYAAWHVDDVDKLLRNGQETVYVLEVEQRDAEYELVYSEDGVLLRMHTPARAPTPGQLAVFYDGDAVVGSAWIV